MRHLLLVLFCWGHSLCVCPPKVRIWCRCIANLVCRPHHPALPVVFSGDIPTASWWLGGMWSDWSNWWCFFMFFMLLAWGRTGMCMARTVRKMFWISHWNQKAQTLWGFSISIWYFNIKSSPCVSCSTVWPEKSPEMHSGWSSADLNCCYISVNSKRSSSLKLCGSCRKQGWSSPYSQPADDLNPD